MRIASWVVVVGVVSVVAVVVGPRVAAKEDPVRLPAVILEFANATVPGGSFELEVDADGTVYGIEAEIPLDQVPQACRDHAEKLVPGGTSVGAEREWAAGEVYHEVLREKDGVRHEILMKDDGTVVGTEESLPQGAPAAVLKAVEAAFPGSRLVVAEKVTGVEARGADEFHVKVEIDGEVQRVSVSPEGKVLRVLRKMKAEVRVPRR
jgi:hypothetical protein